MKIKIPICL